MRRTVVLLTLALALVAAACGTDNEPEIPEGDEPDTAEPVLGAGPYPIADLTITMQLDPDADSTTYRLACLGDTATLTGDTAPRSAESMCLALNDLPIRDRLVNGAPAVQVCTLQYGGPEVARVTGTLDGSTVDTELYRSNGCGIAGWQLLSAFVPPA